MPTQLVITRSAMPVASISSASKHDNGRVIVSPVRPWRSTSISSAMGVRAWLVPPTPITASLGTSRRTASAAVVSLSSVARLSPSSSDTCGLDAGRSQSRAHARPHQCCRAGAAPRRRTRSICSGSYSCGIRQISWTPASRCAAICSAQSSGVPQMALSGVALLHSGVSKYDASHGPVQGLGLLLRGGDADRQLVDRSAVQRGHDPPPPRTAESWPRTG